MLSGCITKEEDLHEITEHLNRLSVSNTDLPAQQLASEIKQSKPFNWHFKELKTKSDSLNEQWSRKFGLRLLFSLIWLVFVGCSSAWWQSHWLGFMVFSDITRHFLLKTAAWYLHISMGFWHVWYTCYVVNEGKGVSKSNTFWFHAIHNNTHNWYSILL